MTNKICSRCKKEKPISEYHRHPSTRDGRDSQCKECHNLACKKYDQSNKGKFAHQKYCQSEKGKLTKKQYNQSEEGKLTRKQYDQSNKGKLLQKKYYQSEAGKAVKKKASKKWRSEEENRFRWDVERQARHWLKKLGIDIRNLNCYYCAKKGIVTPAAHFHHLEYNEESPLYGVPCCTRCHKDWHIKRGKAPICTQSPEEAV